MVQKRITPDDFTPPVSNESSKPVVEKEEAQHKEKSIGTTDLIKLVEMQSSMIERLEAKLQAFDKVLSVNKSPATETIQEEIKRIEESSKTQRELLVARLKKQEQMGIMIPLGINEKAGATHEVGINGVVFVYPKGTMLKVPETVYNLLADSYNITASAGMEMRADRDENIMKALS